ncbi:CAP domain-containing protein [Virgibacillus oceani]|uniref:Membrane protein YlbC n=1 Tax=Virgibacillus oceani TaxID=1479511 RepID=A0A917M0H7_9BACI|nr:CAP domain-containing protein [Virgibacillus oceani]GGG69971.1 putative membrane protein YlbC [Virgibacillus oceani]
MRYIQVIVILILLVLGSWYIFAKSGVSSEEAITSISKSFNQKKNQLSSKTIPEDRQYKVDLDGDLYQWIGNSVEELTESFGKPERKDLSAYGYVWWVYTDKNEQYIQFGIQDNTILTVYATGNNLSAEPIQIGQVYDKINKRFEFENRVTYSTGISSYSFQLDKNEIKMRPLTKIGENVFVQCYFDTFTNKLSSIRVMTGDVLLKHRPYAMEYRGDLPDQPELNSEQWDKVESGMEQQIFDITNVIRKQFDKKVLKWNDNVSEVAFLHSEDMAKHNYFSHYSQNGDGLKERLAANEVYYFRAGENIAAQYPDAPAAMEGWLNSKGHREALLNADYTDLGVGVYQLYYTQNFVQQP